MVKADGYGHGMLACAREARTAGATWLGVATPAEALALREAGDDGRLLAWLYGVDEDLAPLVAADVDVSAQSVDQISRLVAAAATTERRARVHLKLDTGLSRNGAAAADWPEVCAAAAEAEDAGALEVVGVWSHLAAADEIGHPSGAAQVAAYQRGYEVARAAGLEPALRHLANSAGPWWCRRPDSTWSGWASRRTGSTRRPGIAAAGRRHPPAGDVAALAAGQRQGDRGRHRGVVRPGPGPPTARPRWGLVPLGYGDGIPAARRQPGRGRLVRRSGADPRPGLHGPVRGRAGSRSVRGARRRGRPVRLR